MVLKSDGWKLSIKIERFDLRYTSIPDSNERLIEVKMEWSQTKQKIIKKRM